MIESQEIYERELEEIRSQINKLEVEESKNDWKSSWWWLGDNWPDKSTCLIRKANWQTLQRNIQRRIELIKENQLLINKFLTQLSKVEGKITNYDARLTRFRDREESSKVFFYCCYNYLTDFFLIFNCYRKGIK